MATVGTVTTYNQASTLQMRSVRDAVDLIGFKDAPLLKMLGLNNEKKFRLRDWPRIKYEWFQDVMLPRTTTVNENPFAQADGTLTVADGSIFKAGDLIKIESEIISVTSVSGNNLTVVRGASGTADVQHATGTTVENIGVARAENSDYALMNTTAPSNLYNYTQIWDASIGVSGSEEVDSKYGINSTMAYHMTKLIADGNRAGQLPILLEKSFYHGKRYDGTTTGPRTTGGFDQFVTTNLYTKSGAALDLVDIENAMQACNDAGGRPDTIIVNAWGKRKISEFFKGNIRTERSDRTGGAVIDTILTDFGELDVVYDWLCPTDSLYIIEAGKMGWVEFRPFQVIDLPVTVDGKVKRVLGEYGFVLMQETAHAKISGFSTSV